ncbi:MAG: TOBE domain-containing protein, partial [Gemmatimonadales bacterium]|nr:TOBE domain-containing protein [Gemmatimonadales bacterium]
DDGARLLVPDHPILQAAPRATIAIRPEWHDLARPGAAPPGENALAGTVQDVIYLGETMHVQVTLADGTPMRVALRNEGQLIKPLPWRRGDACLVAWQPEDCQVLEPA